MKKYKYVFLRLLVGGSNNSLSKIVVNSLSVSLFLFFRQLITIFIIFINILFKKESLKDLIPIKKDINTNILILKLMIARGVAVSSFYYALSKLPVSFVSISEAALSIICTMLVSYFLLKERYDIKKYFFIFILMVGIILSSQIESEKVSFILWIVLILNGLGIALDAYYNKLLNNSCTTNQLLFLKTFASIPIAIILFFLLPNQMIQDDFFKNITFVFIFCFLLSSIAAYLSNLLIIKSVGEIGPTKTNVFTSIMPVVSVIFAIILFKETFTTIQFIGFLLVIFGLIGFNINKFPYKKHERI